MVFRVGERRLRKTMGKGAVKAVNRSGNNINHVRMEMRIMHEADKLLCRLHGSRLIISSLSYTV